MKVLPCDLSTTYCRRRGTGKVTRIFPSGVLQTRLCSCRADRPHYVSQSQSTPGLPWCTNLEICVHSGTSFSSGCKVATRLGTRHIIKDSRVSTGYESLPCSGLVIPVGDNSCIGPQLIIVSQDATTETACFNPRSVDEIRSLSDIFCVSRVCETCDGTVFFFSRPTNCRTWGAFLLRCCPPRDAAARHLIRPHLSDCT